MELLTQNLDASLSVLYNMTASLSSMGSMSGDLIVPQGGSSYTHFSDTGDGNIVITSTQLTATDDGGNIEIEG
jgi:hypothetical protein